ncbi:YbaK/EbsC family protein [Morganella sp. EGD-HP17]|uniref:YbaK/EbsC family protein n=1 Tax=Morganella sp. EGD-HP17 TaxID=1435146 RepID=UPI0004233E54|nr:YbaK/EbsC family protein [Morganella sp. EGD-HP17]ETO43397.1 hypothetical protein X965_15355 [Morganella sp. EGD-HP17]
MSSSDNILRKITTLLDNHHARYEIMSHDALGFTSDEVAQVRGVELGQCTKAVVLKVKGNGVKKNVLAVLPGDEKIDGEKLAGFFGAKKISFATAEQVKTLTDCVPGALAPFTFNPELELVIDPVLFERYTDIAFNAGTLTETIVLNAEDYRTIVKPQEFSFIL